MYFGVVTIQMLGGAGASRGKTRRSPSTETTILRMATKEDGKERGRESGKNPFPMSRVQKILKADTVKHLARRAKESG
jgi:hypothetical protein